MANLTPIFGMWARHIDLHLLAALIPGGLADCVVMITLQLKSNVIEIAA